MVYNINIKYRIMKFIMSIQNDIRTAIIVDKKLRTNDDILFEPIIKNIWYK